MFDRKNEAVLDIDRARAVRILKRAKRRREDRRGRKMSRELRGCDNLVQHVLERTVDLRVTNAPGGDIAAELIEGAQRDEAAFLGVSENAVQERPNFRGV